ncbi:MAG: histidine kinase [Candidatus Omnitrophica bacterium CG12_big_fil_rev_8_21_14_0_65_43_15]|uniref:Histidine kinase n=1 Tax=Candidatus Taenaricola geysiri TaxID=1974752 RepID=A0A2J0LFQ8_9BACT|nr:MAG: histidine kinase [Candidatus Omnitrophica bacterium CG12_big_fil_rev_8_21_14_0_65_43_15]PIW80046.1 MAG: histidine kinase [Candidatus Omnitrophica bacterium CG_4_8_14_3_um_filter_43_15]PIY84848.1 MAG: histidine kinase [Candidatus Omnitrophica bacterium CG_4_10_14_0_8_um_filter_43_18]
MENINFQENIKALSKISKAIASDLYLEDILRLIVSVTAEVMGSNICSLILVDEAKQELVIRATQSISEEYNKKKPLKIGEGIAGKAIEQNRPIVVKDVTKEAEYKHKDIAKKEGLKSLLCVPLVVKNKVIGAINCYTNKAHNFSDTEINILTSIASQAAVAIENTELLVKTKIIREELEARKKVERAKGILMKEEGMAEDQAYLKLQKYSMDMRKSMREVAEAIILAHEFKKQ